MSALVEGSSIRSVERMTGSHRDTIIRLGVRVGEARAALMDREMRDLPCKRVQVDEIWCYGGEKQRHLAWDDDPAKVGDLWTWCAIDADTELVPVHHVGKREARDAQAFIANLAPKLRNRVQISSDKLAAYTDAIELAFGTDVDYGQIVKTFESEPLGAGRYSPPKVIGVKRTVVAGAPQQTDISTTYVGRQNLTMRMQIRRFTRLTNAFSKRVENLKAAVALHFAAYNYVRIHSSLRVTPAMAAGVSKHLWSVWDLVRLLD